MGARSRRQRPREGRGEPGGPLLPDARGLAGGGRGRSHINPRPSRLGRSRRQLRTRGGKGAPSASRDPQPQVLSILSFPSVPLPVPFPIL